MPQPVRPWTRGLLAGVLSCLAGSALAEAPPYGTAWQVSRNLRMAVSAGLDAPFGPASEAGFKISGTNVNLAFAAMAQTAEYSGSEPWAEATLVWIEAKVGDSPWHRWEVGETGGGEGQDPPGTVWVNVGKGARFASTHFQDGASIPVQVKAAFTLERPGFGQSFEVSSSINVEAYNRALCWGTDEDWNGSAYYRPNPEQPLTPPLVATEAFNLLYADELPALRHTLFPASAYGSAVKELQEDELEAEMDKATLYVAMTHGAGSPAVGNTGLRSSYDDGNAANGDDELLWAEIGGYVARTHTPPSLTTTPLPNMSLVWACANSNGLAQAAAAFGMVGRPNAAHAGFEGPVAAKLAIGAKLSIAPHMEAVLN